METAEFVIHKNYRCCDSNPDDCDCITPASGPQSHTAFVTNPYNQYSQFRGKHFLFAAGHFDYFSGAEKQAVYFARELVQHLQAKVTFIGWGGDGRFAEEIRSVGAIPLVFPLSVSPKTLADRLRWLQLARYIRKQIQPDYILPYVWMHCRVLGAIWKLTGARFCWWNQRDEGRGICGTRLEHYLMRSLPAIVSNSWEGRDFLVKRFQIAPDKITVINNGIELPSLHKDISWKTELGITKDSVMIAMVANLTRFKDHATLLKAFEETQRICPDSDIHLVLIGKTEEMTQEIKALAWELNLGRNLHLVGAVKNVNRILRSVDIVVHSSLTEGCPNGALEAMSLGLPVLGTNISGMRQALGENAADTCLAPPGDWMDLAKKIAIRINSPSHRETEGQRNRERIANEFSITKMTLNSLEVIKRSIH
jgi:glycosyltransferase involved in cell wall biosynthesis